MMRRSQGLDRVQTVLILAGRVVVGVLLAVALSVVGIATAWGMFVFSGAASHAALLAMFMTGAGLGAGLGSLLAWTRIDGIPSRLVLLTAVLTVVLAGIAGAWGGFQFGATQEVECCVGPTIEPITYMVGGAILLANLTALTMALAYDIKVRGGWRDKDRPAGASGNSRSLPN